MKRRLLIVSGLLLLTAIGIFVNFRHCPHVFRRLLRAAFHQRYIPASDIKFRWNGVQAYNSRGPRGSTSDSSVLKSSDCVIVEWTIYRFTTSEDAEAQFHEWVRSASEVIEASGRDNPGAGQRAVLRTRGKEDFQHGFNIISEEKDSPIIYSIWSNSLEHATLLEERDLLRKTATQKSGTQKTSTTR